MNNLRRATLSAALIVLVCFFLPWVQVSCGGAKDTDTGLDLAREGTHGLWLIPGLMVLIIVFATVRALAAGRVTLALLSLMSGLVSTYLMNHERLKFEDHSSLITATLTGWFWLGMGSSIAIAVFGAAGILRRSRAP